GFVVGVDMSPGPPARRQGDHAEPEDRGTGRLVADPRLVVRPLLGVVALAAFDDDRLSVGADRVAGRQGCGGGLHGAISSVRRLSEHLANPARSRETGVEKSRNLPKTPLGSTR